MQLHYCPINIITMRSKYLILSMIDLLEDLSDMKSYESKIEAIPCPLGEGTHL